MTFEEFEKVIAARTPGTWVWHKRLNEGYGDLCWGGPAHQVLKLYPRNEGMAWIGEPDVNYITRAQNCADEMLAVVKAASYMIKEQGVNSAIEARLSDALDYFEAKLAGL